MDVAVIIAAAGSGSRMGAAQNKALLPLCGRPMLQWSLEIFDNSEQVREIVVAAAQAEMPLIRSLCLPYAKVKSIIVGGGSRIASVAAALSRVSPSVERVAVHDAARPLLTAEDWQALLAVAAEHPAVLLAERPVDSVKLLQQGQQAGDISRDSVALAQTPQIFAYQLLLQAYRQALREGRRGTDDSALVEQVGQQPLVVWSSAANFKLTYQQDLLLAEMILRQRLEGKQP